MNHHVVFLFTLTFLLLSFNAKAQQNYSGNSILSCKNDDKMGPSPSFLYTCNGFNKTCMSFLIFKSKPPFNSITTISNLTSSNPEELARINDVTVLKVFPTGKEVIVPLNCSCLTREYYQAETKYVLGQSPTYFTVANDTFEGLTTCDTLMRANSYGELDLLPGMELHVPLRCACPTWHQITNGTKYLLTYSVNWGDSIKNIAARFNVAAGNVVDANGFSTQTQTIFPFTTVLIPLPSEPVSSMAIIVNGPPAVSPLPVCSSEKCNSRRKLYIVIATTGGSMLVLCVVLFGGFLIKLQGYCENDGFPYLVYEFMENGSLREWLSRNRSKEHQSLAWRILIALDVANGLQYLHNFTEPCYVHRNINSGNILLNRDLRAKIANFALVEESESKITSGCAASHVVKSRGYTAPEYLEAGMVTTKMDVFAFGVVLLELITGKDSVTLTVTGNSEIVCAPQLVKLGLACLIQEPAERPTMVEVVSDSLFAE